jgi:lambda family phage portal protein
MKPNLLERARTAFMAASLGWTWKGGYSSSSSGWSGSKFVGALSYNSIWMLDHAMLRAKARIAYWDSSEARALISRILDNVVNWGLTLEAAPMWDLCAPDATPDARRAWVRSVQQRFMLWMNCTDPDAAGRKTGYQLTGFGFLNRLRDGEIFAILRYSGDASKLNPLEIQFIEPDQIVNPVDATMIDAIKLRGNRVIDGIEIDSAGREIAIYVQDQVTRGFTRIPQFGGKSRRRFYIHSAIADSVGQVRGISELAHVVHELQKLTDYGIAELEAAVINAIFAMWIKPGPSASASKAFAGVAQAQAPTTGPSGDPLAPDTRGLVSKPGILMQNLKAGEEAQSFDTKRPNVNFEKFHDIILGNIATSKGVPLEIVKMQFGQNYSASRATILFFWNAVESWRYDLAAEFLNVIYEAWLAAEIDAERIQAAGFDAPLPRKAWLNCEWTGINKPSIDPQKEATAADLRIAAGLTTREREAKLNNGSDFSENIERLAMENEELADANAPLAPAQSITQPGASTDMPADGEPAGGQGGQ